MNLFNYRRRLSHVVHVGDTPLGGPEPIRVQSMNTTSTMDTQVSVAQVLRIARAGGEYVRPVSYTHLTLPTICSE